MGLDLVKAYFADRYQYVRYKKQKSSLSPQNLGVIQGSKTGPLYFDIYSNEFYRLLGDNQYVLYADDTSIAYVGDSLPDLVDYVNQKLEVISNWCKFNKLALNPEKSEFMLVTNRHYDGTPHIVIDGNPIRRVDCTKYLGLYLDNQLKFHSQIENIEGKLSRYSGISFRLRNHFNRKTALKYYYSCVYSSLSYCIAVWGGVSLCTSRCARILRLQRRIVKNLFSRYFPNNPDDIFKVVCLLKFPEVYKLKVSIYMYRIVKLEEFNTLSRSLNMSYPNHHYPTSARNQLLRPFPRTESIRMNYKYQFCDIWNGLPESVKEAPTLKIFKKTLTDYYLSSY